MVASCCRFLCYFCRISRQNQKAMFEHLSYLLENSSVGLGMCSTRYHFHLWTQAVRSPSWLLRRKGRRISLYVMMLVSVKQDQPVPQTNVWKHVCGLHFPYRCSTNCLWGLVSLLSRVQWPIVCEMLPGMEDYSEDKFSHSPLSSSVSRALKTKVMDPILSRQVGCRIHSWPTSQPANSALSCIAAWPRAARENGNGETAVRRRCEKRSSRFCLATHAGHKPNEFTQTHTLEMWNLTFLLFIKCNLRLLALLLLLLFLFLRFFLLLLLWGFL